MKIASADLRPCVQALADPQWKFARAQVPRLEGWVLRLADDDGHEGLGYCHAIPAISTHGAGAEAGLAFLAQGLVGRPLDDLAGTMEEVDATLAYHPTVKAAIDMALHDLLARRLGVPVNVLLGGRMRDAVALSRILPIKAPDEMAAMAERLVAEGYRQLKLKLSGDTDLDVQRIAAVRAAAGEGVTLTLDPNQSYHAKQLIAAFGRMERYGIALIEQPFPAADIAGLALLTRTLPVAIEADESAQSVRDVFRLVSERVVDVINLKVTNLGGIRRFMQALRICEAGEVGCRVGAAFGPALLQAMSLQAASVVRRLPYACELSEHLHLRDDPFTPLPVHDGRLRLPQGPGCGVRYAS
ncbi:mandelate racemase/muconate lactonizing enzyme family protein [Variovorax sp.]|uniref:mandelate racemase/muconate lactonizing enzyme family protein n=1 Tax=Variovorax sp. TaxID=1871043 RepID=UPI002D724FA7|nr:enolase C-terminal domain-like protein [Variovorax sp.]HYP83137.1 enolase C-terminal domain-like protein [Variovorax sp.]